MGGPVKGYRLPTYQSNRSIYHLGGRIGLEDRIHRDISEVLPQGVLEGEGELVGEGSHEGVHLAAARIMYLPTITSELVSQ